MGHIHGRLKCFKRPHSCVMEQWEVKSPSSFQMESYVCGAHQPMPRSQELVS